MSRSLFCSLATVLISSFLSTSPIAQEAPHQGRPLWRSFDIRQTGALPQTNAAAFDDRGLIYAANESGLLSFDGMKWATHFAGRARQPLRDLAYLGNGSWLAGGPKSLGVFTPSPNGTLVWTEADGTNQGLSEGELLNLVPGPSGTYAITDSAIMIWEQGMLSQAYSGLPTGFAFTMGNFLVASIEGGVIAIEGNNSFELTRPPGWDDLEQINVMHPPEGNPILVTKRSGLFSISLRDAQIILSPIWDTLPIPLETVNVSTGTHHADGSYLLGTESNGILQLDALGKTIRTVNQRSGFHGGRVRSIISEPSGNAFAFHDGGMVWLDLTDEKSIWDNANGLIEPITAITVDGAATYAGSDVGVFRSVSGGRMRFIDDIGTTAILSLTHFARSSIREHTSVLVGRENGLYDFFNNELSEISSDRPSVVFVSRTQLSRVAMGSGKFIQLYEFDRGEWRDAGLLGTQKKSQVSDLTETEEGDLLVALSDGSVLRYAADDWLSDDNLLEAVPLNTQNFPRTTSLGGRPQFAGDGDKIHLFASGTALLWDYRSGQFSTDTALSTELALLFGGEQPRWLSASRDPQSLWFQSSNGTFALPSETGALIQLQALADGTDRNSSVFIDQTHSRVMFGTPEGLLALPGSAINRRSPETLPPLQLRQISVDGNTVFNGEGNVETIEFLTTTNQLTLKFAVLDWSTLCADHKHRIEIQGLHSGDSIVPVDGECKISLKVDSIAEGPSTLTMKLLRDGEPSTQSQTLFIQKKQDWFISETILFAMAAIIGLFVLIGGLKPKRVWQEPFRR